MNNLLSQAKLVVRQEVPGFDRDVRRLLYDERTGDMPGYIYLFRLGSDAPNFIKIGYAKDVDKRMLEWEDVFATFGQLELIAYFFTSKARYVERALHLLFSQHRLARYLLHEQQCIYTELFYAKTRDDLLPQSLYDPEYIPDNIRSYKREIEWFHLESDSQAIDAAQSIISIVDQ